ncbi:MAG: glycosyltransferase, partial [Burkholderiaceae bacterium]
MTVQILIPAYNAAAFIDQTLDSALRQQVDGLEIVVLDNCSTDDTVRAVRRYAGRGVRVVEHDVNVGSLRNHNRALELASADYVKLLSSDDVLLPGMLAKQVAALDAHPEVGVVSCNCRVTDERLNPRHDTTYLPGRLPGREAIARCARGMANLVGAPSNTLLRRSAVRDARFDRSLKWLADLDFVCQVLGRCDYFNIDEVGFLYRRHDATDTRLSCPTPVRVHDEFEFARRYGGGLSGRARSVYRAAIAEARAFRGA